MKDVLPQNYVVSKIALNKSPSFSICLQNVFPLVKIGSFYQTSKKTDLKPPAVCMHFLFDPIYIRWVFS